MVAVPICASLNRVINAFDDPNGCDTQMISTNYESTMHFFIVSRFAMEASPFKSNIYFSRIAYLVGLAKA